MEADTIYRLMCDANTAMGLRAQPENLSALANHLSLAIKRSAETKLKRESIEGCIRSARKQMDELKIELNDLQELCPHLNTKGYQIAEDDAIECCLDCGRELQR